MEDKETWKNAGKGQVWLNVFDPAKPGAIKHQQVRGGGTVVLTTQERLVNQDRAASEDLDMFVNGTLTPVRLVDSAEDYEEIASNPNLLSEDDMRDLFKMKTPTFKKRLGEITNQIAMARMLEMASDEGEDLNVSMAQLKAVEARLSDLRGGPQIVEVESPQSAGPPAPKKMNIDFDV